MVSYQWILIGENVLAKLRFVVVVITDAIVATIFLVYMYLVLCLFGYPCNIEIHFWRGYW